MHLSMVCQEIGGGGGEGGKPTEIRLSEAHVGNVPRIRNLTQPPSWKVKDKGMSDKTDKRSAILENIH